MSTSNSDTTAAVSQTGSDPAATTSTIPMLPGAWPLLGHLKDIRYRLPEWAHENHKKYGPVFRADLGFGANCIFIEGVDSLSILNNRTTSSADIAARSEPMMGSHAMIVLDGKAHRKSRGAISKSFSPGGLDRAEVLRTTGGVFASHVSDWAQPGELNLHIATRDAVFDAICRVAGVKPGELSQWRSRFRMLLLGSMGTPENIPGSPAWIAKLGRKWLDKRLLAEIHRIRGEGDESCLLGSMVHARDEDGAHATDEALLDNLRLLVLAGHETTASTIGWAMLHLARDPKLWQRLVDEATSSPGSDITSFDGLSAFPFAEALFRESVRFYPPITMETRTVEQELTFHGVTIAPGEVVASAIANVSRDPSLFDNAEAFDPERWLGEGRRTPTKAETCQFGGGPHFCLGYHLAVAEATQCLVNVARQFTAKGLSLESTGPLPKVRYYPLLALPGNATLRVVG